jgi:hypothetical protein
MPVTLPVRQKMMAERIQKQQLVQPHALTVMYVHGLLLWLQKVTAATLA